MSDKPRHLRAVDDDQAPPMPPVAGYPGAYTVRRPGQPAAEAIIASDGHGTFIMYGFDPDAADYTVQWRANASLGRIVGDTQAGRYAVWLIEAYATGVPGWHQLLAAALRVGGLPLSLAMLHQPFAAMQAGGVPFLPAVCTGEGQQASPLWAECPTVLVLAEHLGVDIP